MTTTLHKPMLLKVAVILAALLAIVLSAGWGVAAAGGDDNGSPRGTVCVDGYVINHREVPVDGTRALPPLVVQASGPGGPATASVDSQGYFKFDNLPAGQWQFSLPLPTDWDGIVPQAGRGGVAQMIPTLLEPKDGCYRIVFKIRRLFDITVIKWEESLDGTVSPGSGWKITFTPVKDPFVKAQTKTTNSQGTAVFTVTPGTWTISEQVKPGWHPITPSTVTLTLDQYAAPGATDPVVFKNREPVCKGSIQVEKHGLGRDANGGLVWLGPLAGWQITLTRADGAIAPISKTTDASGRATFSNLTPGVYVVTEHVQVGWKPVGENPRTVVLRGCETASVLFENEEISGQLTIRGKKTYRVWTGPAGGLGLAGWQITATLVGTSQSITTTTNALGEYFFSQADLAAAGIGFPGATVQVCEEERYNWIPVTPKCQTIRFPYPVPPDYTGAVVNFVNVQDPPLPGTGGQISPTCQQTYQVQPGDTLSGIARRFGTTVQAIAQASGIRNPNHIRAGQLVCVR